MRDHPQFDCALPLEAMAYDLDLIQDLGANSVRTSHYPNDERFLDLCDERGILVWEENHARGLSLEDMQNPNFEPQAENVIREMIMAHYNHPSIYIWGIPERMCERETEYGKECYEKQFDLIRSMHEPDHVPLQAVNSRQISALGLPDVVSYNIYPHWYHDTPIKEYLEDLMSSGFRMKRKVKETIPDYRDWSRRNLWLSYTVWKSSGQRNIRRRQSGNR